MRPSGRILIVDDNKMFLDTYHDILSREGYTVETAASKEAALQRLDEGDWDVVLLDQKLLGPSGPDQGIELVEAVHTRAPGAKPIIVTAYATQQSIERAFDAGVYDFLEKTQAFEHLLRAKVRNAVEAVRERRFGQLDDIEPEIMSRWTALAGEQDANRKGRLLEELFVLLVRSIDGFQHASTRRKSEDEEIDIVIRNESRDPLWSKESPYFLVECKNWSKPVDPKEYNHFKSKLENRFDRATLGFFVAASGFTRDFHSTRQRDGKGQILIICIGPADLEELVTSKDRNQTLKKFHDRAIISANGSH